MTNRQVQNLYKGLPKILKNPYSLVYWPKANAALNVMRLCREARKLAPTKQQEEILRERLEETSVVLLASSDLYMEHDGRDTKFSRRVPGILDDLATAQGMSLPELVTYCRTKIHELKPQLIP